jgi:hypothetical protein
LAFFGVVKRNQMRVSGARDDDPRHADSLVGTSDCSTSQPDCGQSLATHVLGYAKFKTIKVQE